MNMCDFFCASVALACPTDRPSNWRTTPDSYTELYYGIILRKYITNAQKRPGRGGGAMEKEGVW